MFITILELILLVQEEIRKQYWARKDRCRLKFHGNRCKRQKDCPHFDQCEQEERFNLLYAEALKDLADFNKKLRRT